MSTVSSATQTAQEILSNLARKDTAAASGTEKDKM